MKLKKNEIETVVSTALNEDVYNKDITSRALNFKIKRGKASIKARQRGVLCGIDIAAAVFRQVSPELIFDKYKNDGDVVEPPETVAQITGKPYDILAAERTSLNIISHMSGIATITSKYVEKVKNKNPECDVYDTRKTLPGLRKLEKYAVCTGGGKNHRMDLSEQVLIKENHISFSGKKIDEIVKSVRENTARDVLVEIEVETESQALKAAESGVDIIMLDNFSVKGVESACRAIRGVKTEIEIEVSGGINMRIAPLMASAGVNRISIGRITASAPSLDFSMIAQKC